MTTEVAATGTVIQALSQAKPAFWTPIVEKIALSNDMKEICSELKEEIAKLCAERDDHQIAIQGQKMKMPSKSYDQWIDRVKQIEEEVKKLLAIYDKESKRSRIVGLFQRANFSNKMKKKIVKAKQLLEDNNGLGSILVDKPPEPVIKLQAPNIGNISTFEKLLKDTLHSLENDKGEGIAITGMMGTGKTAIMMNLNNHEKVAKRFHMVMWINVSAGESNENLDMSQLQKKIAKRLKVDREGANDFENIAERISNELNGKRYLLLLDDVKANLNIHQMGIPPCKNGSKIVLTTRENQIHLPRVKFLKLTPLPAKESFRMFKIVANCPKFEDDREAEACVRRIVQECGGLPLLINIIASVFQKKDLKLWSEGLKSLERFSEKGQHELRNVIKFCYDDLEDIQRKCLLYGVLYPEEEDICIDRLLECWEAENFLGNGGDSRNAYMDRIYILKILKDKSLLEEHENPKYVTMHKCIRQILLHILSNDPNNKLLVQQMPPDANCWSEKEWISLIGKFDKLPDRPNCGRLSTLFLQKNLALKSIPASFFDHTTSLKVLDLLHTGIELLPSSLSKVIELKVLYLDYCEYLKELPSSLQELQHLEVLDIRGSGFSNIPSFIGKLKGLRRFRVSFAKCESENGTKEVESNCNVISNLSKLEELIIDVKSERHQSNKVVVNIIKNVVTLENLTKLQFCFLNEEVVDVIEVGTPATYLRINFPEADILYTYIEETRSWRSIQDIPSFQFFIDCPNSIDPCIPKLEEYGRYVRYCNGERINHPIFEVLANVDAFDLVNKKDIKHLSDLRIPSMKEVKGCQIESCTALETVVDSVILPNVKHLYMKNLPKLKSIWNDQVDSATLTKLKTLVLSSCQMLRIIFPLVVIQHLCEIECLKIEDCPEIVEMVEQSATAGNQGLLPKLRKVVLCGLPKLGSICADNSLKWPALEKLKIRNCPALIKLPFGKDDAENLKLIQVEQQLIQGEQQLIQVEKQWWENLQNQEVKKKLQKFCTFRS